MSKVITSLAVICIGAEYCAIYPNAKYDKTTGATLDYGSVTRDATPEKAVATITKATGLQGLRFEPIPTATHAAQCPARPAAMLVGYITDAPADATHDTIDSAPAATAAKAPKPRG